MSVESLKCKECGTTYELDARYVCENCFGPLEVTYDFSGLDAAEVKRRIQAGSQGIWRYADFLPFAGRPGDPLEPGLTPLLRADRLAERLGIDAEIWIKNDAANPTHSFKDRVVAVAVAKAQELGFDDRRLRLDRQPRQRGRRPRRRRRARLLRLRPRQPRGAEAARDRRLRDQPGRRARQLRRRQPALHPARRDPPVGLRQRQPAPLLRRGLEDARLRDRRAARLGAARPGGQPDRLRLALHQARPRLPGVARPRARRAASSRSSTAPRPRAAARSRPPSPKAGKSASRSGRRRSPRASRSATRPTVPTRSSTRARTGGGVDSVTDQEIRDGIKLLAETTGIFTETAGGVTVGVLRKLAERGELAAGERVVVYITGEGLKTLDATRDTFQMHEIDPDLDSFEAEFRQEVAV